MLEISSISDLMKIMADELRKKYLIDAGILTKTNTVLTKQLKEIVQQNTNVWQYILKHTSFLEDATPPIQRLYYFENNLTQKILCSNKDCNHPVKFISRKQGFRSFCSPKCNNSSDQTKKKKVDTCQKHFGCDSPSQHPEIRARQKKTCQERYGADTPVESKAIQDKIKRTFMEKYGVDNPTKVPRFHNKQLETNKERHGCQYPFQSDNIQEKVKKTISSRYGVKSTALLPEISERQKNTRKQKLGVEFPFQSPSIQEKINNTFRMKYRRARYGQVGLDDETYALLENKEWLKEQHLKNHHSLTSISKQLGVDYTVVKNRFQRFNIETYPQFNSFAENEIATWLEGTLKVKVIKRTRKIIPPFEIDIFLPEYNLAIEYNGLYWHSEIYKKSDYHLQKTMMCEQKGIRLIHIFEDEWCDQQQKCKDTIQHLLGKSPKGTYARDTYIKEIPWKQARDFLNKHHLLGAGSSGNYRIGAFDKQTNELIGVMVFGRSTSEGSNEIELKRFVTNKKNNPGLGSKMFKYAVKNQGYQEVIAFVDRRWFTGLVKDHIGFERIYETKPAVWWTNGIKRYHRRFKTKQQLVQSGHNPKHTKTLILHSLGYCRIYDCGKIKLKWAAVV